MWIPRWPAPPGGHSLITSAQDLARFLEALLAGRLFARPETLAAMTTMVDAPGPEGFPHRYGLGLESYELDGTTVIGHSGSAAGYASMMFKVQGKATTLVTSINTNSLFTNALEVFMPSLKVHHRPGGAARREAAVATPACGTRSGPCPSSA